MWLHSSPADKTGAADRRVLYELSQLMSKWTIYGPEKVVTKDKSGANADIGLKRHCLSSGTN